ncbi:hypothetical protein BT67DRAFT_52832 [Trichocladium antarcticum]|uniref:Xylanolytic transcriptional activator regulatory domain-containing protein n=1 Tax=Trichocladium antarcticum TaxID=1450529 RepID=A0AAN6UIG7_9PEZI|nr:hypothetical protein BT67DRAFT_52832 [Trichocladium antarcticum]
MLRELAVSISSGRSPSASANESGPAGPRSVPAGSSPAAAAGDAGDVMYGAENDDDAVGEFEGDSSMAAQTVFASEFLEHTVTRTLPADLDPDMRSALSSLQQIVRMQNRQSARESRFAHAKPLPRGGIRELPMPPAHVVIAALREVKDVPLVSFATICTFIAADNFTDQCRKVYFATEDYSLMRWGVVNAGLYFLFQEKACLADDAPRARFLEYQALCRDNLETALTNLPLLLPARRESLEVLLLGAFYAIEISKFSLARDLNSIAATLCQTLGYHRLRVLTPENEGKAILFWAAYLLDKALSLRSGRAPVIQDYDVTVPRGMAPPVGGGGGGSSSNDVSDISWRRVLDQWIACADFLGRAYEQLYSPAALARPPEQRAESARQLVETLLTWARGQDPLMRHIRQKLQGTRFDANSPFSMDMAILGDELLHWSALTLVYRAIPSPPGSASTFNHECIHAARQAFASHHEHMQMAGESLALKSGFIRWNIIYVPFIPVIVLFCHVVETSDEADLARLAAFAESLQPVCQASEAVDKLHRICQVLHDVASLCIRARAQRQQDPLQRDHDMAMVGDNIDLCLSQLGFMPQYGGAHPPLHGAAALFGAGGGDVPAVDLDASHAHDLGNWFSGNTHILGLLEEDLSDFEPRVWSSGGGGQ